jgi:ABC-type glycerol-3-phosphate transport system permease component
MSTKNQREQLMHTAIGQIAMIVAVLVGTWLYTIPLYNTLSASVTSTNEIIEKFTQTSQNGIPYKDLDAILRKNK